MPASLRLPAAAAGVVLVTGLGLAAPASGEVELPTPPLEVPVVDDGSAQPSTPGPQPAGRASGEALTGVFEIEAGACGGDGVSNGSYFRMVTPSGEVGSGPYAFNSSSACDDNTFTPLAPGSDGGLSTAGYQPMPDPPFSDGHATAARIVEPTPFNGVRFSVSTNPTDPQTELDVSVPQIEVSGGTLSGDVRAFAAHWNNQHFNQGSPKPDGGTPGNTAAVSGTYDPATGAFTLEWASQIQGGPFNNFTGFWHLEGTFRPAGNAGSGAGDTTSSTSGGTATTTGAAGTTGSGDATVGAVSDPRQVAAGSGRLPRTGGPAGLVLPGVAMLAGFGGLSLARRAGGSRS